MITNMCRMLKQMKVTVNFLTFLRPQNHQTISSGIPECLLVHYQQMNLQRLNKGKNMNSPHRKN